MINIIKKPSMGKRISLFCIIVKKLGSILFSIIFSIPEPIADNIKTIGKRPIRVEKKIIFYFHIKKNW